MFECLALVVGETDPPELDPPGIRPGSGTASGSSCQSGGRSSRLNTRSAPAMAVSA